MDQAISPLKEREAGLEEAGRITSGVTVSFTSSLAGLKGLAGFGMASTSQDSRRPRLRSEQTHTQVPGRHSACKAEIQPFWTSPESIRWKLKEELPKAPQC